MKLFLTNALSSCLIFINSAHASEPVCFKTTDLYMISRYRPEYASDENITAEVKTYGTAVFTLTTDKTPGTNIPISLLAQRNGTLCEVLTTPPVATFKAVKFDKAGYPITFFAKDQGVTSQEITYSWDRGEQKYRPCSCRLVRWTGKKKNVQNVSCSNLEQ
jgi:hypothetical protein